MRFLVTLMFLFSVSVSVWAFDFKGIIVGDAATPTQILERLGAACPEEKPSEDQGMQVCSGYVTVARESAFMVLHVSPEGIVQSISLTLSPDAFEAVAPELIRKFGKPRSTSRPIVQNKMGATFAQVVHLWTAKNGTQVTYMKYTTTVEESGLYFSTKAYRRVLSKDKENRSGDL